MGKIGLITDDMTGTMTCGVLLAQRGIKACSYFSEDNLEGAENQDAVILSTNSRNLPKDEAKASVKRAYRALKAQGVEYFTKRIDTTFRGGIGYEVDALLEELPEDTIAIVAAAMPDTRRILVGGYSVIDGTILTETGAAKDVLFPIKMAHIPTILREQSGFPVAEIGMGAVLGSEDILAEAFTECKNHGARLIVVDGITHAHLEKVANVLYQLKWNIVCVDPGAFTQKMAFLRGFGEADIVCKNQNKKIDIKSLKEKVLIAAGSATDVTKNQIKILMKEDYSSVIPVGAENLIKGADSAKEEIEKVLETFQQTLLELGSNVIAFETASTGARLDLKEMEQKYNLMPGQASGNINKGLGKIIYEAADCLYQAGELAGIYMTGGDTLVSILRALGAAGIRLVDTVQPQTNLGMIIGGKFEGVRIVGKGGLIGADDTVVKVAERLFREL